MHDGGAAAPESEQLTDGQRRTLLVVAVAGHGLKHLFNAAFFVLLPEIKTGLGLTNSQIGILSTFRNVLGGITNIPAGYAGDRMSAHRAEILGASIIFLGIFALALGLSTTFWMAVVFAALFNVAITFWHPSAISSLSREFESRRGFAISLHGTGGSVGETLGPVLAGTLIGIVGWQMVLRGSIVPGVIAGILIWLILRTIPTRSGEVQAQGSYLTSLKGLIRNRRLLLVLAFAGGFVGGQSAFLTFFPIYLRENLGSPASPWASICSLPTWEALRPSPSWGTPPTAWAARRSSPQASQSWGCASCCFPRCRAAGPLRPWPW